VPVSGPRHSRSEPPDRGSGAPLRRGPPRIGWIARFALLLGSLAVFLIALELGLWLFGDAAGGWFAAGPQRLTFLERYVDRNRDGFRDREFEPPPPPGVERIAAVGDSFTFGDGIREVDDTWPRVLERTLSASGPPARVFNLGVPGSNTEFQRRLLERLGPRLAPDRIVVGFVLNDAEPPGADRAVVHRKVYVPLVPIPALDAPLTRVSYAYSWLRGKKNQIYARLGLNMTYGEYLHGLYRDEATWARFAGHARGLVADARVRGVPVAVVVFPMLGGGPGAYPFEDEHRRVVALFREAGATVVDLLEVYADGDPGTLTVSPSDAHPNETAHRVAAEAIAATLRPMPGPTS
jgi:lysophospholipase L1-like esterase